jgi:hypothetical protein
MEIKTLGRHFSHSLNISEYLVAALASKQFASNGNLLNSWNYTYCSVALAFIFEILMKSPRGLTHRSTRTLPLRGTVLAGVLGFLVSYRRAASAAPVNSIR